MNAHFHLALRTMHEDTEQLRRQVDSLANGVLVLRDLVGEAGDSRSRRWDLVIEAAKELEQRARRVRVSPTFLRELRRGVVQEAKRVRAEQIQDEGER